jgi:hypothetical protein
MTTFLTTICIMALIATVGFIPDYGPVNWVGASISFFIAISTGIFSVISMANDRVDND